MAKADSFFIASLFSDNDAVFYLKVWESIPMYTTSMGVALHRRGMGVLLGLLFYFPICTQAQLKAVNWQRVYTAEEFIIDADTGSLTFVPRNILRARFRLVYSKGEPISGNPRAKYKTRIETIDFKPAEKRYRFVEVSLLDSTGKIVQSSESASQDWTVLRVGGIMERQLAAAQGLPPFGFWKVIGHRYAEGGSRPANEPHVLANMVGVLVILGRDDASIGAKGCRSPVYQSRRLTDKEYFHEFGTSLSSIGIKSDLVDAIFIKCETNDWKPPQSVLLKLPKGEMLMLWDGVFLVLKRESR